MMIGVTEAIIGAALYLLWKGGVIKKEAEKPKTSPVKPAAVKWPVTESVFETETREGFPPGHEPTVIELQQKEAADVARAKKLAKGNPFAQAEIRKKERVRQKALQDYAEQRKAYEEAQK